MFVDILVYLVQEEGGATSRPIRRRPRSPRLPRRPRLHLGKTERALRECSLKLS